MSEKNEGQEPVTAKSALNDWLGYGNPPLPSWILELVIDAKRWRWLRNQEGWPASECEASGQPPEWFDRMADEGIVSDETLAEQA